MMLSTLCRSCSEHRLSKEETSKGTYLLNSATLFLSALGQDGKSDESQLHLSESLGTNYVHKYNTACANIPTLIHNLG